MDRLEDSNRTDSCRYLGNNNSAGTPFTLNQWMTMRTNPSQDSLASFGRNYGSWRRMDDLQKENLIDILDEATRIIDEVLIDVASNNSGVAEAATKNTSTEAEMESLAIPLPTGNSDIDASTPLQNTDEFSTSEFLDDVVDEI